MGKITIKKSILFFIVIILISFIFIKNIYAKQVSNANNQKYKAVGIDFAKYLKALNTDLYLSNDKSLRTSTNNKYNKLGFYSLSDDYSLTADIIITHTKLGYEGVTESGDIITKVITQLERFNVLEITNNISSVDYIIQVDRQIKTFTPGDYWSEENEFVIKIDNNTNQILSVVERDEKYYDNKYQHNNPIISYGTGNVNNQEIYNGVGINRNAIVSYAYKYYNSYNSAYNKYDADCTNFVSQALRAGGWDMTSHWPWQKNSDDAWFSTKIPIIRDSTTWTSANSLNAFGVHHSKRLKLLSSTSKLKVGDILQVTWGYSEDKSIVDHSMIVTKVVGSKHFLTYHTENKRDVPLSKLKKDNKNSIWYPESVS